MKLFDERSEPEKNFETESQNRDFTYAESVAAQIAMQQTFRERYIDPYPFGTFEVAPAPVGEVDIPPSPGDELFEPIF